MTDVTIGLVGLAALLVIFMTGIELSFAMAIVGFVGFSCVRGWQAGLDLIATDIFDMLSSYGLTVVPLFVLMGQIAFNSGIAQRLYNSANKFIGHVPGGLAMATVAGATVFKAICGSGPATAATFASVAVPEMDKYGYGRQISTGIVASVGTLGILLPPSLVLIMMGLITEQSIGRLFLAGVIPGLMIALFFMAIIYVWCRIDPAMGPRKPRSTWRERLASLPEVAAVVIMFLLMIGGLMAGFFTPTEAGSVGTLAVLLLALFKKDLGFQGYVRSVREALRTAAMVLMLVACSAVFGHFLTVTKIPMIASEWIISLPYHPYVIMIAIIVIYQIGGSFIEDFAFLMLATPIFYPVIGKLGFDPIWFAIIISINLGLGCVLPPMALNVFVVQSVTKESLGVIFKGTYPFLISLFACGVLLFLFPGLATWLPNRLMR
jgi:tripartite ATP-independent transporter DctM subunit